MTELLEYNPLDNIRSSYKDNNIGRTLEIMTLGNKPTIVVECGVLDGYSLYHFAKATKANNQAAYFQGHVFAYDLFEEYEYKHGSAIDVHNMLKAQGVEDVVSIMQGDAYKVHDNFDDKTVDLLHIDISNDGDTYLKMFELWSPKISHKGRIVFEGGSVERDSVSWMKKYNKRPIRGVLSTLVKHRDWQLSVIKEWPSITVMKRR